MFVGIVRACLQILFQILSKSKWINKLIRLILEAKFGDESF